jgi:ribosome assembly protein YihI (activator of Der GTPase)
MPREKKSRKVGKIGLTKTEAPRKPKRAPTGKSKTTSGNKSGTRQQVAMNDANNKSGKNQGDPRIGSKTAINLTKYENKTASVVKKAVAQSPQQELDAIEQDMKLEKLLSKQETKRLSSDEKAYVEGSLKRHKELCAVLGIDMESDEAETEIDPFAQLDAIRLDDFKD